MKKIGIFMADGCEEIEGLTVVDLVRRAKLEIVMISISDTKEVTGSHGVKFMADALHQRWILHHWTESFFRAECREQCTLEKARR